jgi:hypothetical protein
MSRTFALVLAAASAAASAGQPAAPPPADGAQRLVDQSYLCMHTLADLRSIRMAIVEYAKDHGSFPRVGSIEELRPMVEPMYLRKLVARDAWGTEFLVRVSGEGRSFVVASAGSDLRFAESTWSRPGLLGSSAEDAVLGADPAEDREWTIQAIPR